MTLELAEVLLRKPEPHDAPALYQFKNDADVVAALGGFSTGYALADIERWIEFHRTKDDEVLWTIAARSDDKCIGHAGLYNIDYRIRKAEFAILIGDSAWRGKGLGKSVSEAVIRFGFDELNLRRIELTLIAGNQAALSLYQSLGFEQEGVMRDAQFRGGKYCDVLMMALLNQST